MRIQCYHFRHGFLLKALPSIKQNAQVSVHIALYHQLDFLQFFCRELVPIQKFGLLNNAKKITEKILAVKKLTTFRMVQNNAVMKYAYIKNENDYLMTTKQANRHVNTWENTCSIYEEDFSLCRSL